MDLVRALEILSEMEKNVIYDPNTKTINFSYALINARRTILNYYREEKEKSNESISS